ncbi:MAG: LptF/LptG family permease [Bacteroidales bacterium]|mgnify:FL=1|nr:LptF/LptG family permease [Bacteroidales bacterium]MBR4350596.1 LptF/LptG family permease [Bacteroidales bacterium]MBR6266333.1 LptF/LptG family permease [Bacteroidales bacterium]MCR4799847.1 LptF/LptG family permease [Bacteroidales bacterium]
MIKRLDWYIIKKFLGTFFLSMVLIMAIAIIFDFQEKYDDFISHKAPIKAIIFDYYLNFIPYYANMFSSMFVFISVIFFTSKMAANSEIIAMHAGGISFHRFLVPYMITAGFLAIISWALILYVIPESNKVRIDFEDKYVRNKYQNWEKNIHRQVRPGMFVYMDNYNVDSENAFRFAIEKFEDGKLISKLTSDYARWDSTKNVWTVYNYFIRDLSGDVEKHIKGARLDTACYLEAKDLKMRDSYVEKMNIVALNEFIETQKLQGTDNIEKLMIEKHQRWALPFSTFILTLLGVCLSNKKKRGGTVINIVIGTTLCFTYILLLQVSTTFTLNLGFSPFISVWMPNFLYAIIAFFLYKKATI